MADSTDFSIQFVRPELTRDLRHKILRPHQSFEKCAYPGDDDSTTFHLAAFHQSQIICVGSFYREGSPHFPEDNQYRLRGMATDGEWRRRGAGAQLLQKSYTILKSRGCPLLWCYARQVAFPFYEGMGFQFFGDLFEITEIGPHKIMIKKFSE